MELLFIFCCVWNYYKAKAQKLNAGLWAFYTFLAVLVGWIIGLFLITIIMLLRDPELQKMLMQPTPNRDAAMEYMKHQDLTISQLLLFFSGFGGYLFTRYRIEQKGKESTTKNELM